eukprot:767274-Hanusia_phi.AAC.2
MAVVHIMEHRDLISQRIEDALRARCEPETVRIAHALRVILPARLPAVAHVDSSMTNTSPRPRRLR